MTTVGVGQENPLPPYSSRGLVRPARQTVFAVAPVVVADIGDRIEVPPIEAFGDACHRFQVIRWLRTRTDGQKVDCESPNRPGTLMQTSFCHTT